MTGRVGLGMEKPDRRSGRKLPDQKEETPNCQGAKSVKVMVVM